MKLTGKLSDWVSAKDVILEMLRRYDVKGCVGKVVEYYGPGVATLSVEDRAAIGNMGTELGATSSLFPSDEQTRLYLAAQGREEAWQPLSADDGASYDAYDEIDLATVEPGGILPLMRGGAKIHQSGCLGCIGMGQAPGTGQVSLRTFPRNFPGRSGTKGDQVYLCSPKTAVAAALTGVITDPRELGRQMTYPQIEEPQKRIIDRSSVVYPKEELHLAEVVRGPNIKPFPEFDALPENLRFTVAIKVGDNIATDGIMPVGNKVLPLRSNIEAISEFVFYQLDADFHARCRELGDVAVVGGDNYGQGSSREHAALAPRYLGVRVKLAKSFARIHQANLCNFGVLPLIFKDPADYERLAAGAVLEIDTLRQRIERGDREIPLRLNGDEIITLLDISQRQRDGLLAGGTLNQVRQELGQ